MAEPGWPARGAGGAQGRGHVAGGHAITRSTWAPVWGATWQAGKWRAHGYSGPWLVFRGGNAIGVYRPLIYRSIFFLFLPCGTMSHTVLTLQGTWRHDGRQIRTTTIARHRSRGLESTRSDLQHVREIEVKWPRSKGYAIATWYLQERPIFRREAINKSSDSWRQTLPMIVVYGIRLIPIVCSPDTKSDGADKAWKNPQSRSDRAPIEPRSRRDRAAITILSLGSRL